MQTVAKWDVFETSFELAGDPGDDPLRRVTLTAVFVSPGGARREIEGFWAGGRTWKVRFMPNEIGTWRYSVRLGEEEHDGAFASTASDLPGMVTAHPRNPIWLGYAEGKPSTLRSFHAGDRLFASNFPDADRAAFLDWLVGQGYTMLSVASFWVNRQSPGRGMGWETPRLWPIDPAEYDRLETILDDLKDRRVVVFPFAGFFGRSGFNPNAYQDQVLYLRYLIARYGSYWNLIFNVAGPEPLLSANPFMTKEQVDRLGRLVERLDPYDHLVTVHNATWENPFLLDDDYIDVATIQGPKTRDQELLYHQTMNKRVAGGPVYAQETLWPGNTLGHPDYDLTDIRRNAITLSMTAATINFGDFAGTSSSGFSGSLRLDDRRQAIHDEIHRVWDLMDGFVPQRMRPEPGRVDTGFCLAGEESLLVYLPDGGEVTVSDLPPLADARWVSPRADGTFEPAGDGPTFTAPGSAPASTAEPAVNVRGEEDWLLYLTFAGA